MKRIGLLVITVLVVSSLGYSEEVYCRYQYKEGIFYGKVEGNDILQLTGAPWHGGKWTGHTIPKNRVKFLHPSEPTKILGMSGTYKDNYTGGKKPFHTIRWFLKPYTSAASPGDDIVLPAALDTILVETELVIVIGKQIKNGSLNEAKEAIFGYSVGNDIVGEVTSYHRINKEPLDQTETLLPFGLKMGDGFAPYGPYIYRGVDWKNRQRTLQVTNAKTPKKLVYEHNTSNLYYPPEKIVRDLSRVFTLYPGDVIYSGTTKALPAQAGDDIVVTVEGLGTLRNQVKATRQAMGNPLHK